MEDNFADEETDDEIEAYGEESDDEAEEDDEADSAPHFRAESA
jgi:hypothetical protein